MHRPIRLSAILPASPRSVSWPGLSQALLTGQIDSICPYCFFEWTQGTREGTKWQFVSALYATVPTFYFIHCQKVLDSPSSLLCCLTISYDLFAMGKAFTSVSVFHYLTLWMTENRFWFYLTCRWTTSVASDKFSYLVRIWTKGFSEGLISVRCSIDRTSQLVVCLKEDLSCLAQSKSMSFQLSAESWCRLSSRQQVARINCRKLWTL
jgi:hypothetical protein